MKILKKINKGFLLTLIVILALIIYIVSVEIGRNAEKKDIEKACEEYIALTNKYLSLPEEKQKLYDAEETQSQEKITVQEELTKEINLQMEKFQNELKTKMIDNERAVNMQKDKLEETLKNENDAFKFFVKNYDREISKIRKFEFDEDQVTVTFNSNVENEIKYLEEGNEMSKKNSFEPQNETITLKKVDDVWKVVYADMQYEDYSASYGGMVTMAY